MTKEHILIVDDSKEVREFLTHALKVLKGYQIKIARNGQEGLNYALKHRPDLIITDQVMPHLTGLEMVRHLRQAGVDTPVILVTAEGSENIAAQAIRIGVSYYFIKPFDMTELQNAIIATLDARRAERSRVVPLTKQSQNGTFDASQAMALLHLMDSPVVVVDNKNRVVFCNTNAEMLLFAASSINLIGRTLSTLDLEQILVDLFSSEHIHSPVEVTLSNGRSFNVHVREIRGIGRAAVFHDITVLKEANQRKSEFVATLAHDLRSPLTAILSYVELVARLGELNPAQKKLTSQMAQGVERITALLNDLLELSRIEAGYKQNLEPTVLKDIIIRAVELARPKSEQKKQQLTCVIVPDTFYVLAHPLRLQQVFTNLVENAVKYTPEGGVIKVSLGRLFDQAICTVADTGIGIPQKDLQYIFDKFYRVEEIANSYEGTGLGLSIVKTIIDAYNGRIWVDSQSGQGTTFTIMLPIGQSPEEVHDDK